MLMVTDAPTSMWIIVVAPGLRQSKSVTSYRTVVLVEEVRVEPALIKTMENSMPTAMAAATTRRTPQSARVATKHLFRRAIAVHVAEVAISGTVKLEMRATQTTTRSIPTTCTIPVDLQTTMERLITKEAPAMTTTMIRLHA